MDKGVSRRQAWTLLLALLALLASALPAVAWADGFTPVERTLPLVVDDANLLTAGELDDLTQLFDRLSAEQRCEIAVVTVGSLGGKTAQDYADDFFDTHGYGFGPGDDGIMLLVSMEDRDWWVTTHGRAYDQLSEDRFYQLTDDVKSLLSQGRYYDAFETFGYNAAALMSMPPPSAGSTTATGPPTIGQIVRDLLVKLGISLLGALAVAGIVNVTQASKHESVRMKQGAQGYLVSAQTQGGQAPGGRQSGMGPAASTGVVLAATLAQALLLRGKEDVFLYTNTNRVRRVKASSSSGSSGGGGFGSHTSSSGRTHGGGGGKF